MHAKHTPGPWSTMTCEGEHGQFIVFSKTDETTDGGEPIGKKPIALSVANARLIAAAPDLLAALKTCMQFLSVPNDHYAFDQALAALVKAEGFA